MTSPRIFYYVSRSCRLCDCCAAPGGFGTCLYAYCCIMCAAGDVAQKTGGNYCVSCCLPIACGLALAPCIWCGDRVSAGHATSRVAARAHWSASNVRPDVCASVGTISDHRRMESAVHMTSTQCVCFLSRRLSRSKVNVIRRYNIADSEDCCANCCTMMFCACCAIIQVGGCNCA